MEYLCRIPAMAGKLACSDKRVGMLVEEEGVEEWPFELFDDDLSLGPQLPLQLPSRWLGTCRLCSKVNAVFATVVISRLGDVGGMWSTTSSRILIPTRRTTRETCRAGCIFTNLWNQREVGHSSGRSSGWLDGDDWAYRIRTRRSLRFGKGREEGCEVKMLAWPDSGWVSVERSNCQSSENKVLGFQTLVHPPQFLVFCCEFEQAVLVVFCRLPRNIQ